MLSAMDLAGSRHTVFSVEGCEIFDRIVVGVTPSLHSNVLAIRSPDTRFACEFTINFVSGSKLEIICQELQVEVR